MKLPYSINHILVGLLILNGAAACGQNSNLKLWYNKPASSWEEALPLGNSITGDMVFGRPGSERFQLNDHALWSGYPADGNNAKGPEYLPQVRKAVFDTDYDKATQLWIKGLQGPYTARYMPLSDLLLDFKLPDTVGINYYRDLNLNNAISTVKYQSGGVNYKRETFISYPDKVMAVRITADKPGAVNFTVKL